MTNEQMRIRCFVLVTALVGKKYSNDWWSEPNDMFNGEIPIDVLQEDTQRVYDTLMKRKV